MRGRTLTRALEVGVKPWERVSLPLTFNSTTRYYCCAEQAELVKGLTGASKVVFLDVLRGLAKPPYSQEHMDRRHELATRQEYVQPLRNEVEAVMKEEGWSKGSVRKLWKVDSFIKECMRVSKANPANMGRKVLKDFTFSDGVTVPAGGIVMVPFDSVHTDPNNYIDSKTFDGFRFEKMRRNDNENLKHQFVSLSVDYVLFGHGRHACPGRFFVANELKIMLSHVLLNYDIKMVGERGRPKNWSLGVQGGPNTTAKMLFRKRAESGV